MRAWISLGDSASLCILQNLPNSFQYLSVDLLVVVFFVLYTVKVTAVESRFKNY